MSSDFISPGDKVRIVNGPHKDKTGIVTYFNHGNREGISYKSIRVRLDGEDVEVNFQAEEDLEKVNEDDASSSN